MFENSFDANSKDSKEIPIKSRLSKMFNALSAKAAGGGKNNSSGTDGEN